ncbi:hypothetical protein TorRG33x02_039550 [Trema orientale]|uniref:Uncharacterized protein n=1 Tax=Trema orientale TaxID=63057 RepID=A0A2P5FQW5_TREOI|nr:hypothetical protein TorRG33x02_039550 [Trema orientale]
MVDQMTMNNIVVFVHFPNIYELEQRTLLRAYLWYLLQAENTGNNPPPPKERRKKATRNEKLHKLRREKAFELDQPT